MARRTSRIAHRRDAGGFFEEHRIPVDAIAGTSIGALVGAAYATGRPAAEVVTLVGGIDWDRLFSGGSGVAT